MDVFVARQPIFDRNKNIHAYELLFRSGMSNAFPSVDGETATSSLLSSSFFTVGIDMISGGKPVFINFTEELLLSGAARMFPQDNTVIEILENIQVTTPLISACRALYNAGYTLALDDFVYQGKEQEALIEMARIIKIDFRATPIQEIERMVADMGVKGCEFLAEKVETYEEFNQALAMGFSYFQGYFFARPEVLKNKDIAASQITILQLIEQVNGMEFNIGRLVELINSDVSISYKLLNYLNSAYFSRLSPISSLQQAITFLGERGIRLFVSLIATSKLAAGKPDELLRLSIIRARFLQSLAETAGEDGGDSFLLGLFSLLDAMLDNSMERILSRLPINDAIKTALVERRGQLFSYINLVELYERGQWAAVDALLDGVRVAPDKVPELYMDAVNMANNV
ncbi:MAG: HDOD domain-containing protein [Desulfobulbaceae bacterium]|jgi:EAL and modified HD-GYP domain-containing signal transduction protein|nr:HDOD domain-containing protein [Desulfobulbaceae bacterium]